MLIDTSGFFSIHSEADLQHAKADEIYNQTWFRLTTSYVLDEFVALATARKLSREKILAFSEEILIDETVEIVWVNKDLHTKAVELLNNRRDKVYSLCDAVSFVVMRERKITEALTTDHHFEQETLFACSNKNRGWTEFSIRKDAICSISRLMKRCLSYTI